MDSVFSLRSPVLEMDRGLSPVNRNPSMGKVVGTEIGTPTASSAILGTASRGDEGFVRDAWCRRDLLCL